ncbi:hypothetical protein ABL78_3332 [Leptomonas seymouri]|uniref:C3H1-type domain-containing protein n=1 Tax=Leptomonas seymouri TaxID=5684 RepID=A0A0N1HY30_LEPSE|nr:hypothetical protein ABL78_3332 [Leptomonas seymouri]|eukprot:KPI87581.1 hypothetical protein ABL78_3332 [Leptomonas seymouri]
MSYLKTGAHLSLPSVRIGSAANSLHASSYGNPNSACSLGSTTLLRPRQSSRGPQSALSASHHSHGRCPTSVSFISAIDTASTKLSIPISAVEPTLAFEDDGLVPGLCRLYLEGRCRQGDRCFQVHADPTVIAQLRNEAYTSPSCCPVHGAKCKLEGFPLGLSVIIDPPREREAPNASDAKGERESASTVGSSSNGDTSTPANGTESKDMKERDLEHKAMIMLHNVCPTRFLWARYEETGSMLIHVPKSKICREHRKGLCRFGDECSFLHLCRQIPLTGSNEELSSHSRTRERAPHSSMPDFGSHPPSFAAASGSLHQGLHSYPASHSMNATAQCQNSMLMPQNGSFVGGSFGGNHFSTEHRTRDQQPLLRPLGGVQFPQANTTGSGQGNLSTASSMHARGSFSHNPYAEVCAFQN